jgi:protein O-GlcNAc transferase
LKWYSRFLEQEARWDDALIAIQDATLVFEQRANRSDQAGCLNNIGMIYNSQGQLDTALDYFQRALVLNEQVGSPAKIANSCHNIASLRLQQEQWQDAIRLFLRALNLHEQMGRGFESNVAGELERLAYCCMQLGESEKGATYTKRAKQIREQLQKSKTE